MKKTEVIEAIKENNLLLLIDSEFKIIDRLDEEKEEIIELIEKVQDLDFKGYDYIDILDEWEYRVIPENIIDDLFYDETKELVTDCYLWQNKLPAFIENNIDWEWIAKECMQDGYWHHFNWYDGWEIQGHDYYLFRNN